MKISQFLDFFIPEKLKLNIISYSRARISAVIILLNILLMTILFISLILFTYLPARRFSVTLVILPGMISLFSALLLLIKRKGWVKLISNFYIFFSYSVIVSIFLHYSQRNLNYLLILLPSIAILSFTLVGFRNGFLWILVIACTHIGLLVFKEGDLFFKIYEQPMIFLVTYVIILISGSTYEYINRKLMIQLDFERNMYRDKAHLDKLTKIPNRYRFDHFLDNAIIRAYNSSESFALVYIDLNGFKPINDKYGHSAGDLVLIAVAERLQRTIRHSDLAARLGGDEFAVIFQNLTEKKDMEIAVKHIRAAIERPVQIDENRTVSVSGSMGVVLYNPSLGDREALIKLADEQMYAAKKSGTPISYL